ncbi:uncharacterized protein LOC127139004 [Lates calcarifer]|uniref:Uncharacterized protein LOC127139004 n=1 Tax=Lates calcarifer TaxID=8187 RepID=A0AAJ8B8V6_LATCA|nr:uncharacterized protein LOC127139004 [Lates calcarifer]
MSSPSPLTICLCIQLSLCLLGSNASVGTSLWGKKGQFGIRPCLWQLDSKVVVPALTELSVCILLRHNIAAKWTAFVYKAPGGIDVELGIRGTTTQLTVLLFGVEQTLESNLRLKEWYSVCLTWSSQAQRLRVYINNTILGEAPVNRTLAQRLAPNGTLTLGVSHNVDANGKVQPETENDLIGEIGLFRIWAREWNAEDLRRQSCADGDVVSWDLRHWTHDCFPVPDNSLYCAWSLYKIKMWTLASGNCSVTLVGVTRNWLESIFPHNISVHDISVSSPSHICRVVNNSAALHVQQPQGSRALSDSTCDMCFSCEVYVNVDPAANVGEVQTDITARLSLPFFYNFLNLTADPSSISILPAELFPMTEPSTTVSTGVTTSGKG